MTHSARAFQAGPDPFDRLWHVEFLWLQTGISIRHADTVDVKFVIWTEDEPKQERVIALNHPDLLAISAKLGRNLTDAWCMKLAAAHLRHMIESGEDLEKKLVTVPAGELERYAREVAEAAPAHA